jgi:hypothetical protein
VHEELDSHSWEIRETFAYYGRAVYTSSVVEVALAHVLLFAQFMKKVREGYIATKGKGFDRKQYERNFDAFMDDQFAQTMGNLMRRVEKFGGFDDALKTRIADAKKRRDFLTHHYWRERSVDFATSAGRERMREELNADAEMFEKLDRDIDAASAPLRASLGIKDEILEDYNRKFMKRGRARRVHRRSLGGSTLRNPTTDLSRKRRSCELPAANPPPDQIFGCRVARRTRRP